MRNHDLKRKANVGSGQWLNKWHPAGSTRCYSKEDARRLLVCVSLAAATQAEEEEDDRGGGGGGGGLQSLQVCQQERPKESGSPYTAESVALPRATPEVGMTFGALAAM